MGCLIALTCEEQHQQQKQCVSTQTSRATDPDACLSRNPFETVPPDGWKIYASRKEMIRQSKAEKILGKTEKAVHLLERGIAVGHGIYRIGQALAPVAAALV